MIPAVEAEALILDLTPYPQGEHCIEQISLTEAQGRILAQPVSSDLDFPHWDNSAMDGYAVRYADVRQATAEHPVSLSIIAEVPAGKPPTQMVQSGQAARILTGAMLPDGADTIVMQENTQRQEDRVKILEAPTQGQFVRH